MSENNAWKVFRPDEVALHNTKGDCWLIIDGKVYDISGFEHPGGNGIYFKAGGDATKGAHGRWHPPAMWEKLKELQIGVLESNLPN